jgi:hypothetical protein
MKYKVKVVDVTESRGRCNEIDYIRKLRLYIIKYNNDYYSRVIKGVLFGFAIMKETENEK